MLNGWFLSIVAPSPLDIYIIPHIHILVNRFYKNNCKQIMNKHLRLYGRAPMFTISKQKIYNSFTIPFNGARRQCPRRAIAGER